MVAACINLQFASHHVYENSMKTYKNLCSVHRMYVVKPLTDGTVLKQQHKRIVIQQLWRDNVKMCARAVVLRF